MTTVLDISEVCRRTGLTSRALRFYEARGLLRPERTAAGRRLYEADQLERLNAIVALKAAGFTLSAIGGILAQRRADLGRLIAAQLEAIEAQAEELAETQALLRQILSRIDRGEPIDVATLCSLIRKGTTMEQTNWKTVSDRYFSPQEQADFADRMEQIPAEFDQAEYSAKWRDLGGRIEAALPLDPASAAAGEFVREWFVLLEPFARVATPAMNEGVMRMYGDMDKWEGQADPGFSAQVFRFIQEAAAAHPGMRKG